MSTHFLKVESSEEGERLDSYVVKKKILPSRAQIQKLIEQEKIKVNGLSTKASHAVKAGDTIAIEIPPPTESILLPQNLPIHILYEDDDVVIVNKEAGRVVHPGAGNKKGTLVNALLFHCRNLSGIGGVMRPGVVHRLDKDTSGLILFAKNDEAHLQLANQFKKRTIKRHYKTIVFGKFKMTQGTFDAPIGRHPAQRKKMSTKSKRGKPALTFWKVLESFDQMSFVDAVLATGRTHQIRVHFSDAGHPVVGDPKYGGTNRAKNIVNPELKKAVMKLPFLLLHSESLSFIHPRTGEAMKFDAPLPDYFKKILDILHES